MVVGEAVGWGLFVVGIAVLAVYLPAYTLISMGHSHHKDLRVLDPARAPAS